MRDAVWFLDPAAEARKLLTEAAEEDDTQRRRVVLAAVADELDAARQWLRECDAIWQTTDVPKLAALLPRQALQHKRLEIYGLDFMLATLRAIGAV